MKNIDSSSVIDDFFVKGECGCEGDSVWGHTGSRGQVVGKDSGGKMQSSGWLWRNKIQQLGLVGCRKGKRL